MTTQLVALVVDALDPAALGRFWAGDLGADLATDPDRGVVLLPDADRRFPVLFVPTDEPKSEPNQMHPDLTSSSPEDQQRTVARALTLGARHIDVGQRPEEGHVVLADPEGNELCVLEPGNAFLAGCGFLGALACDGSEEVGRFWSDVLGWPLVWDQDQETAIQAPYGGPKITWGGPPLAQRTSRVRWHLDVAPLADGDLQAEVERLASLGATRVGTVGNDGSRVVMADPDGHEFCVLSPR
jgi:predicted enzyme related to lactoylglutathione lyase